MAGNDISSLIQDIYDRYKENQKDKRPEEQIYMSEEEFKANLKSMVNKSEIEDKFMLYNEIYHNITEDALEIDTTGNITISPKVIVNAERAVVRRLEEQKNIDNSKIGIEEVVAGKTILDMTKDEYEKLSYEEKRDLFADSLADLFGTKEEAKEMYDLMEDTGVVNEDSKFFDNLIEKVNRGEQLTESDRKSVFSVEEMNVNNVQYQEMTLALEKDLSNISKSKFAVLFTTQGENGKSYWSQKIIQSLYELSVNEEYSDDNVVSKLNSMFMNKENGIVDEEKVKLALELVKDKNLIAAYAKTFKAIATIRKNSRDALRGVNGELCDGIAGIIVDNKFNLDNEFDLVQTLQSIHRMSGLIIDGKVSDEELKRFDTTCQQVKKTAQWGLIKDNYYNIILAKKNQTENVVRPIQDSENTMDNSFIGTYMDAHNIVMRDYTNNSIFGIGNKEKEATLVFEEIKPIDFMSKSQEENVKKIVGDHPVLDSVRALKDSYMKELKEDKKDKDTVQPEAPSNVDIEMEADFESSLASISDMEPDMFADMFSDMAEEMVFEEPTFETEKVVQEDETHEVAGDDRTAQGEQETQILEEVGHEELTEKEVKGIQVEDIAVDETLTNTMNNENLPKKITWVDKVRASVDAFGKNVKKAFGSFISAITGKGGENNSGVNNSTTSTSSNAGQNKPVQEVNNFVPTVELNLKQAQQATKAAEEAKKNNDARGTDEPTQDDSEIGE